MKIRRAFFWLFILVFGFAAWFAYNYPDWIVAGPPDDFQFNQLVSAQDAPPVVQSAIPEKPVTSTVEDTSISPTVDKPTTAPLVEQPQSNPQPVDKPKPADGFDNRCTYMGDGQYTTVLVKDYDPNHHGLFAYDGDVDANGAPATAEGSVAWCKANDPYKSER